MAKRDVQLVVKAKDEASRSLNKITGALQTLETEQKDLARSADSTGKTLGQLGAAVKKLEAQAQVTAALKTLTASIEATKSALVNQRSELVRTEAEIGTYATKILAAKEALAKLQAQNTGFEGPRSKAQLKQMSADLAAATQNVIKLQQAQAKSQAAAAAQTAEIIRSGNALNTMEEGARRSVNALNRESEAVDQLVRRLARLKAEAVARRTFQNATITTQVPVLNQGNSQAQVRAAKEAYLAAVAALSKLQAELRNTAAPTVELGAKIGTQRARIIELMNAYRTLSAAAAEQTVRERAHSQALVENAARSAAAAATLRQLTAVERAHAEALSINARMAREAAKAMERAQAEAIRMNQAFDLRRVRQAARELELLHREALRMNQVFDLNRANSSFSTLINNLRRLNGEGRQSLSIFERMRGQILAVGASYVGVFGAANLVSGLFDAERAMDGIMARFTVGFNGDKGKAGAEFEYVKKLANDLGLDLKSLARDYSQLTVATVGTNLEGQRTRDIFNAVAKASRVLNLSSDDTSGIIKALTQIVSKGTVMSEELRQQIGERLPGALQLMANGTKITTKELLKLMEQGKLSSDALVNFARELSSKVGPGVDDASKRAAASVERLKTSWFLMQEEINKSGLMDAMGKSVDELVKVMKDPTTIEAIVKFAKAIGEVVVSIIKFIKSNPDEIIASLKVLSALLAIKIASSLASSVIGLGIALARIPAILMTVRAALLAFSPALAAILGPVGLIVLGTAAIAAFIYKIATMPSAVSKARAELEKLTESFEHLDEAEKKAQRVKWYEQLTTAQKRMEALRLEIEATSKAQTQFANTAVLGGAGTARKTTAQLKKEYEELGKLVADLQKQMLKTAPTSSRVAKTFSPAPAKVSDEVLGITEGKNTKADQLAERIRKQNEEFEQRLAMLLAKDDTNTIEGTLEAYNNAIDIKYQPAYELLVKGGKARNSEEALVIDKLVAQEKLIGAQKIQARELAKETKARTDAEKSVNDLMALRELIQQRINFLQKQGAPTADIENLKTQINELDGTLKEAITSAIALYQPLAALGDIDAETTIQKLKIIEGTLGEINTKAKETADQINQDFAGSAASSLTDFGKSLGKIVEEGGNLSDVFSSAKETFRAFAADFLIRIAQMILQQAILKALQNSSSGGVGGAIVGAIGGAMQHHDGGIVGSGGKAVGAAPGWFTNAPRYHTGGVVGLKPDEVPAILQKGEEVLTRNDPRNRANPATPASAQNIKIVNTIDSVSVLNEALGDSAGVKVLMNVIKANRATVKQVLT